MGFWNIMVILLLCMVCKVVGGVLINLVVGSVYLCVYLYYVDVCGFFVQNFIENLIYYKSYDIDRSCDTLWNIGSKNDKESRIPLAHIHSYQPMSNNLFTLPMRIFYFKLSN